MVRLGAKEIMQDIILWVLEHLNYWVVTFFMMIESSFIPFPSEVIVPPAAWLAAQGKLNIFLVVIAATIGADLGALLNYYLAKYLGRPFVYRFANSRIGQMCLLSEEKVRHAEAYFVKHGVTSTLIGRLVPGVRQLISIPAGLASMPVGKFMLYTTIGAGAWNIVLAVIGYLLVQVPGLRSTEDVAHMAETYSKPIGYGILLVVGLVVAFLLYKALKAPAKKKA